MAKSTSMMEFFVQIPEHCWGVTRVLCDAGSKIGAFLFLQECPTAGQLIGEWRGGGLSVGNPNPTTADSGCNSAANYWFIY